ncbi:MAG: hypothetical protein WDN31_21545 [Hyphomicrobium sp.]
MSRHCALALGLAAACGLIAGLFAHLELDPHHDGLMFKGAFDVYHGAIPFKETFTQYGLLLTLLQSWTMLVFGPTVLTIRLLTVLCYALTAALLYVVWLRVDRRIAAPAVVLWFALAPFYLHPFLPWSSPTALPAQVAAVLFTMRWFENGRRRELAAAGACIAVVFWIRMPVGVLTLIAEIAVLVWVAAVESRRVLAIRQSIVPIGYLFLGVTAVSAPLLLYLLVRGALQDWFLQTFMMSAYFARTIPQAWSGEESLFSSLIFSLFPFDTGLIWVLLPLAVLAWFAWALWRTLRNPVAARDVRTRQILALSALCIASWAQYYPVTEDRHVFWAAAPMFGLLLAMPMLFGRILPRPMPWQWIRRFRMPLANAYWLILALVCVAPILTRLEGAVQRLNSNSVVLTTPAVLAGLWVSPTSRTLYENMGRDLERVQSQFPDREVITNGYDPIYLTFGRYHPNFHPLFVFYDIGVAIYPKFPIELGAFIAKEKPIIWTTGSIPADGYRVVAHYANGMSLIEPGDDNTPSFLAPLPPLPPGSTRLHARIPNRFDLGEPMRIRGQRFPAVGAMPEGTIEMLFWPERVEGAASTVMTNLNGPTPGRGVRIHRTREDSVYAVSVGSRSGAPRSILTFRVEPAACNYIAVRWKGSSWEVWRNGLMVDRADVPDADADSDNQVIVNSGMSLTEYHVGIVHEVRFVAARLGDEALAASAATATSRCRTMSMAGQF